MAKRKISPEFRARFSEKLMDLGNFISVGLVIGQFAIDKKFSAEQFLAGVMLTVVCYTISYLISS